MLGMWFVVGLWAGGIPVGHGPGWRAVAYPVKATVVRVEGRSGLSLEKKSLSSGEPSLNLTAGQWYRYHSIATNIYYYTSVPLWIATRFRILLNPGESTPIWIDSLEVYFVADNQDPNLTDTLFLWNGDTSRPTTLLAAFPFQVPTDPAPAGWRLVLYLDDPYPVQDTQFWYGFRSLATATDTVWVASEACNNCDNPGTRNMYSLDGANWSGPFTRDWGLGVFARKSHATDEGVWSFVFPNWPFVTNQMDGDTIRVVHRNWGGNSLNTMGGSLVVEFRGARDTTSYSLTNGPYASTQEDTFAMPLASYVGQGYEGVIAFTAWSAQPGDQDPTNDTLRFSDYIFPHYTVWAEGFEFVLSGWAAYDLDGNGSTWALYVGSGMHAGYYAAGDTARAGENNVLVGPAWTLGGTPGDASYGNVLAAFVNVPAGASVTLTVQALDGPDPTTANVLWQNSHSLTGLVGKAGWVKIQDTLSPTLNGQTVYPAWLLSSTSATPYLILLDNIHGRSAPLALGVGEEATKKDLRIVWEGPRTLRFGGIMPRKIVVLDALGRRVYHRFSPAGLERLRIPLPAGVYTVVVEGSSARRIRVVLP